MKRIVRKKTRRKLSAKRYVLRSHPGAFVQKTSTQLVQYQIWQKIKVEERCPKCLRKGWKHERVSSARLGSGHSIREAWENAADFVRSRKRLLGKPGR